MGYLQGKMRNGYERDLFLNCFGNGNSNMAISDLAILSWQTYFGI